MFKSSWHLCTVFGIPLRLDSSLIILAILMFGRWGSPVYDLLAFALLLLSIVLHELGHSLVGKAFGCRIRSITLMLIGGAAAFETMPRKPWQEMLVALAGPAVSLLLGIAGILLCAPPWHFPVQGVLFYAFGWGNLVLCAFNLIPAFPMDGGRILRAVLQQFFMSRTKATWVASRIGRGIAVLFAIGAVLNLFGIRVPFVGGTFNMLLIAYFIFVSAESEYRLVAMQEGFGGGGWRYDEPPPDEGKAVVGPPPYGHGSTRVDVYKDE
ncbi:MAG: M50 family metallopeptidase [Kiritimatiellae bacterium]|nr:M50 family metallopeptidase [Kiritimatiellia bacterium]